LGINGDESLHRWKLSEGKTPAKPMKPQISKAQCYAIVVFNSVNILNINTMKKKELIDKCKESDINKDDWCELSPVFSI